MKKIVSIILVAVMFVSVFAVPALAVENDTAQFKYLDEIFERFGATEYYEQQAIMDVYDEVYYHYSDDNAQEPDWTLVLCPLNPAPIERKDGTLVGDRILSVVGSACAVFPDGYGVYVREIDEFIALRQSKLEQIVELCPDFIEAIEENEIGQQFGDVDNDGELSIIDATYIQRFLAKLYDFIQTYYLVHLDGGNGRISVCDFDRDGKTTIFDVTGIQRKLALLDDEPLPEPGPQVNNDLVLVEYSYDGPIVTPDPVSIEFEEKLSEQQSYGMHSAEFNEFAAIIKSKEQYDSLFRVYQDEFTEDFFEDKWLLASVCIVTDYYMVADITDIGVMDNTLYISINKYLSGSDGMGYPIAPPYYNFVAVDKDDVAYVTDIVWE